MEQSETAGKAVESRLLAVRTVQSPTNALPQGLPASPHGSTNVLTWESLDGAARLPGKSLAVPCG